LVIISTLFDHVAQTNHAISNSVEMLRRHPYLFEQVQWTHMFSSTKIDIVL